ncbi:LGFP repeat-containing protein [Streptomyces sp. NPDC093088]|uniref:LGFP repeat-containing protein n=1 Tax=Streptomyces sp. NPDC093088 TaxID=3366023 RepID=UPI003801E231
MTFVSLRDIHCDEETDEVGDDEIYVLMSTVNLGAHVNVEGIPIPVPSFDVWRFGIFEGFAEGDTKGQPFQPFWTAPLADPDQAIFVGSVIENDNGVPEQYQHLLRLVVPKSLASSIGEPLDLVRSKLVREINEALNGVDLPIPFALDDDHVGTQELRYEPPELQRAAGDLVPKVLSYNGDGGRYRVTFDVSPDIFGAIRDRWIALGAGTSPVGRPVSGETPTFDGQGRFMNFSAGVISWHPETGAHGVWGAINGRWLQIGREQFGYPITDEFSSGSGRMSTFEALHLQGKPEASIFWTPQTGPVEIFGAIHAHWKSMGAGGSGIGGPVSPEQDAPGGRIQNFQNGRLFWNAATGQVSQA